MNAFIPVPSIKSTRPTAALCLTLLVNSGLFAVVLQLFSGT